MSSEQLQDDWEAAEVNMKALEIKDKPPAPRLLLRPPVSGISAGSGAPSPVQSDNPLDGPVDAALLNALTNPRERMVVFQIENNILNFMNSGERTMDIPPGYNSFRRLLAYRIGQRFGLSHTTSDQLSENGERGIVLYKTSATGFPSQLLIDLNTSCTPVDSDTAEGDLPSPGVANAGAAPRKMMVMKRNVNKNDQPTTRVVVRQAQSSEDKEKAYLEARARIFGETGTPDGSCSPGLTTPTQPQTPTHMSSALAGQEGPGDASGGSGASSANASHNLSKNSSRSSLAGEDATALPQGPLGLAAGIANTSSNNTAATGAGAGSGKQGNNSSSKKGTAPTAPASSNAGVAGVSGMKMSKSTSNSSLSSTGATAGSNNSADGGSSTGGNNSASHSNNQSGSSSPATVNRGAAGTTSSAGNSGGGATYNNNNNAGTGAGTGAAGRRQLVDAGNWKGNKSQLRNVDAERSDPDFMRRSNPAPSNRSNQPVPQGRGNSNMQGMQPNMQPNMPPGANYMDPMQVQMQMQMQYQMQLQMQMQIQQQAMLGMPPVPPMQVPMQPGMNNMQPMQVPMQGQLPMQPAYMDPQQYQFMLQQQMMMQQQQLQQGGYPQQHAQQGRPPVFNKSDFPPLG